MFVNPIDYFRSNVNQSTISMLVTNPIPSQSNVDSTDGSFHVAIYVSV